MKKYLLLTGLFLCLNLSYLVAQHVPVPASAQTQAILISGATAHLGNGEVIENSMIAFENGKITFVGQINVGRAFPNHKVIEGSGLHVYPGFIAPNTTLGLTEIGRVRATNDFRELGSLNPNIRSVIAYNTDSEVPPTVRSMGVLLAQVVPQGGRISGTSSIVELEGWNWEDAVYKMDEGIHLNWPSLFSFSWRQRQMNKNDDYGEQVQEIEAFFKEAQAYVQKSEIENHNLKFEAMKGLFDGSQQLFIHASMAQSIQEAVLFAKKFNITPIIIGGRDSWMITDFLKEHEISIILQQTQSLPRREDDDIDQPFKTPKLLQDAGVLYCFSMDGHWQQRNLAFQAGQAIGYGLTYENAVKALTSNTAKILGIDKTVGTIATGMDATLFISAGDALDMRSAKVSHAFIRGKNINLDNKQEMLYRKFQQKYQNR